jgi:hypothetical protein
MQEYEIHSLIKKIEEETGIDVRVKTNKREIFYSRIVFFKIIRKANPRITLTKMGSYVGKEHSSVIHSLKTYEMVKRYPDFKEIESAIMSIKLYKQSKNMIYCKHITYPNE